MNSTVHKKIYKTVLDALSGGPLSHNELIGKVIRSLYGEIHTEAEVGEFTEIRGLVGTVVAEMKSDGVILAENSTYTAGALGAMPLRIERCEKEIVTLLSSEARTKREIREHLRGLFRTDTTPSDSDDRILYDYIGRVLKRLTELGTLELSEGKYSLKAQTKAAKDDLVNMMKLKSEFLTKLHRKGGEFFEHYILMLLKKTEEAHGKTVTECRTTGGTSDGGIDGIIKTVDHIGFRETVLIQAKNRTEVTTETTVRGFIGALYAQSGTKGIFATTSDFHPSAKTFLNNLDNCIGINGDDIFRLACERLYGIKRMGKELVIDNKIL